MSAAPYWPWWLGAASLAVVTVGCCIVARRPLGVSGILARFMGFRTELEVERQRHAMAANEAAVEAALLAATAEAFGAGPVVPDAGGASGTPSGVAAPELTVIGAPRKGCADCAAPDARPSLGAHATFLAAILLGGLAVQLSRGTWTATLDMGPTFAALFGGGARGAAVLGIGGVLVGIGASVSGGCSTGHGLSGCSRLQPAGVAATTTFFSAAILVSFLVEGRLS